MTLELSDIKGKRRDKLVIMTEIIGITRKGTSKTQIMFKANLSFSQLNQYLSILLKSSLLEETASSRRTVYRATSRGVEFMESNVK